MNRREFVAAAAGAAVALRTGRALGGTSPRVVVVGAGLAGLVCARDLLRAGIDVQVFEARKVVGGRVRTIRGAFEDGQYAEAGGEFVDESHSAMREEAHRLGLRLQATAPRLDVLYRDGRRAHSLSKRALRDRARFWARVDELSRRPLPALEHRSAGELIASLALDPTARFLVEHELRETFAVEPSRLSLRFLALTPRPRGRSFRIRGGNDQLPEGLADGLGTRVSLDAPVHKIEWSAGDITVHAGGSRVHADACVLTAPVPTLADIEFEPKLPARLAAAVEHLQYGSAAKTVLQYEERFWLLRAETVSIQAALTFQHAYEATDRQPGTGGILTAFTAGRFGEIFGKVGKRARVLLAADEIDDVYPGSRVFYEHGSTSAWQTEDFSGGAGVAYAPGQVTRYWDALRRPAGALHLAGEHTDLRAGTMEGAVRSGRRAARTVAAKVRR